MPLPDSVAQNEASSPAQTESPVRASAAPSYQCDGCQRSFEGPPAGSGLYVWTRGDETRYEEPPLCEECVQRITIGALLKWSLEEEEEG
jgi:hypothetical protein